jgi:short subunit dehydrogenase-like uncharacterized protein
MSMPREQTRRADDRLVTVISGWLAGHVSEDELQRELESARGGALASDQAEAVDELRAELAKNTRRAELQMVARETLEALALGG